MQDSEISNVVDSRQWLELIDAYRRDPRGGAGIEIVDKLVPRLRRLADGYRSLPIGVDADDVFQQLVLEILIGAQRMKLPQDPGWIPRRLVLRARTYVSRWLLANARQQGVPLEEAERLFGPLIREVTVPDSGRGSRLGPRPEFRPHRNHAHTTQNPRSSSKLRGSNLWIKKVGPQKGRRSR